MFEPEVLGNLSTMVGFVKIAANLKQTLGEERIP